MIENEEELDDFGFKVHPELEVYRVQDGLVFSYLRDSITVDGIEYHLSRDASPYSQPMFTLKEIRSDPCETSHSNNSTLTSCRLHHKEWSDVQWDPTIRL